MLANKIRGYEAVRDISKFKKIKVDLGVTELELEVRVPLRTELDQLQASILAPDPARVDVVYARLTKDLIDTVTPEIAQALSEANTDLQVSGDKVTYQGVDVKQTAMQLASWEIQVEKYFSLIKSAVGEPINESFEQINNEFTTEQITSFIKAIQVALYPPIDEVKKN